MHSKNRNEVPTEGTKIRNFQKSTFLGSKRSKFCPQFKSGTFRVFSGRFGPQMRGSGLFTECSTSRGVKNVIVQIRYPRPAVVRTAIANTRKRL